MLEGERPIGLFVNAAVSANCVCIDMTGGSQEANEAKRMKKRAIELYGYATEVTGQLMTRRADYKYERIPSNPNYEPVN